MAAYEVLMSVNDHMKLGAEANEQRANMGDLLNYRGIKRMGEFYALKCRYIDREIDRYIVGVLGRFPKYEPTPANNVTPDAFNGAKRSDVTPKNREEYAQFIVDGICEWLYKTKKMLEKSFAELSVAGDVDAAIRLGCLIKWFTCEYKMVDRIKIEFSNVAYYSHHLERRQDDIHDHYKCKTDDLRIEEF